jgi:hypothetical protein
MDQVVAQSLTTYAKIVGLSRQEAVALKTDPRVTRIHVPIHAEFVPVDGNGNGKEHSNGNGNGIGNGKVRSGNGHDDSRLLNGNGNGRLPKRRGRASAAEVLGGNSHGKGDGNGRRIKSDPGVANGNGRQP